MSATSTAAVMVHLQSLLKPQLMLTLKAKPRRQMESERLGKRAVLDAVRSWTPEQMRVNIKVQTLRDAASALAAAKPLPSAAVATSRSESRAARRAVSGTSTARTARTARTAPRTSRKPSAVESKTEAAAAASSSSSSSLLHTLTVIDLEKMTLANRDYRRVVPTGALREQLVLMSLRPGQEIGMEVHPKVDQFIRIERGTGFAASRGRSSARHAIGDGSAVMVPAGTYHNIVNTGRVAMKLYTIYAPPNHPPGTIEHLKPAND